MEIIGVDTGNKNIKTALAPAFNAGIVDHGTEEPPIKVDTLYYNGEYHSLTETRDAYRRDKTIDNKYFNLTLIAIAKQLIAAEPGQQFYSKTIGLALGLPPAHLTSLRDKFIKYFSNDGLPIVFAYNGIHFEITISRVFVFPQGFAAVIPYLDEIRKHTRSYIIDIGGYTTDVIRLNRGIPDMDFCESIEMGTIQLFEYVRRRIRALRQIEVDDYLIDAILRGTEHATEDVEKVAHEAAQDYATKLIRGLEEKGVDTVLSYPIFIGGGALLMKNVLCNEIECEDALFIENVNANAIGYEIAAKAQLKQEAREAKTTEPLQPTTVSSSNSIQSADSSVLDSKFEKKSTRTNVPPVMPARNHEKNRGQNNNKR